MIDRIGSLLLTAVILLALSNAASAAGPVRLVVPFPAGGPTDIVARPYAQLLGEALKTTVIVDNRGGAGGSIGAEVVGESAADGATLLMGTVSAHVINASLSQESSLRRGARLHADRARRRGSTGDDRRPPVAPGARRQQSAVEAREERAGRARGSFRRCGHSAHSANSSGASSRNGARPCGIRVRRSIEMKLNAEEQDILAGKQGPVPQQALRHQVLVGDFFGAAEFVPVTQAHIMADTESLGETGVRWLESLAAATEGQRRVRIPTITDPRGTDFAKAAFLGHTTAMLDLERRTIDAFVKLGVVMTDTCINYQTIQAPTRHEHVAFGDTGVVIYSNSVCGARSNFEGGPSAIAAGITGRTPRYGFHLPEARRATLHVRVSFTPASLNDWGALGACIGRIAGDLLGGAG